MKIVTLVENTAKGDNLLTMHGLSLYIETSKHKILVDAGNADLFLQNSFKLNIKIPDIDIFVITHGHNDHGGGLKCFLENNDKAKIYIQSSAFEKQYVKNGANENYIGLDKSFMDNPQLLLINGDYIIDEEISLINKPDILDNMPGLNSMLYQKTNGKLKHDKFFHEQSVIISDNKTLLIGGCAHSGIVNIFNDAVRKTKKQIDYCISGFHLFNPALNFTEFSAIDELAEKLLNLNAKFYTCHCTGLPAYEKLKEKMGKKIEYLYTGKTIKL